jgi:hypothetical protein
MNAKVKTLGTAAILILLLFLARSVLEHTDEPSPQVSGTPAPTTAPSSEQDADTNRTEPEQTARAQPDVPGKPEEIPQPVPSVEKPASVRGNCYEANSRKPVGGVLVKFISWKTGYPQYETRTDTTGTFLIPEVEPEATFLIVVADDQYKVQQETRLSFPTGRTSEISLPLIRQATHPVRPYKTEAELPDTTEPTRRKNDNHKAAIKSFNALMTAQEEHRSENQTYATLANLTDRNGKYRIPALSDSGRTDHGYTFSEIQTPTAGSYGIQGVPQIYGKTGDYTFVIDDHGGIYFSDNAGAALTTWPSGWTEAQ